MIEIKNLSKSFGKNKVLKNINIKFERGIVYGIVGDNGAGKTTLFRCIAGLEDFEGEVISSLNPLKNYLGFLFSEPYFLNKITGSEYIRLLCNARNKNITKIMEKNLFDLPLNIYVSSYSSGEKKKLALFALLLQENEVYILDEPYNGVDVYGNIIITDIIHKLKSLNKLVIISSHIFSTLKDTCDEIYYLKKGEIIMRYPSSSFHILEKNLKEIAIGNKIDVLGLK